jgi:hypothetical protein
MEVEEEFTIRIMFFFTSRKNTTLRAKVRRKIKAFLFIKTAETLLTCIVFVQLNNFYLRFFFLADKIIEYYAKRYTFLYFCLVDFTTKPWSERERFFILFRCDATRKKTNVYIVLSCSTCLRRNVRTTQLKYKNILHENNWKEKINIHIDIDMILNEMATEEGNE